MPPRPIAGWRDFLLTEAFRVALPLIVLGVVLAYSGAMDRVDRWGYDAFTRTSARVPANDITIIAVDARSLEAIGQWPWSRAVHADLLDRLTDVGVRAVIFDIAFSEPHATDPGGDQRLAEAIARNGRVVLPIVPERRGPVGGVKEVRPMTMLASVAARLGHADVEIDEDGVSRRVYLKAGENTPRWPALGLAALSMVEPERWQELPGARAPESEARTRPVNAWVRDHEVMIGFAGPPGQFRFVSLIDVLRDEREAAALANSYVLVGVTAFGLRQGIVTPVSEREATMSGVEFNANVLDSLRSGRLIRPAGPWVQTLMALAFLLVPILVFPRLTPLQALFLMIGLASATLAISYFMVTGAGIWLATAFPLALLGIGYPVWLVRRLETTSTSLVAEQEHSRAALQSIADAVVTIDPKGFVLQMNAGAERMSGYSSQEAVGLHIWTVFQPVTDADRALVLDSVAACVRDGESTRPTEHVDIRGRPGRHSVRLSVSPLLGVDDDSADALVVALSDITDTIKMSERMAHLATHDVLTGLPNRALFTDRLTQAVSSARLHGDMLAVFFIDVSEFKRINDSLGHTAGDVLLGQLAQRLHSRCRPYDTVARWGGDEFIVMLQGVSRPESVLAIAREFLASFDDPFRLNQREIHATANLGVALFPRDAEDVETLLANADAATHRAKQQGSGSVCFYSEPLDRGARHALETESALRGAVVRGEMSIVLQPLVEMTSRKPACAEALLRWQHPRDGELGPADFLDVAEDNDLMTEMGEWVLEEVCGLLSRHDVSQGGWTALGVNVSTRQLLHPEFVTSLRFAVELHRIDPSRLVIEVAESVLTQGDQAERTISALQSLRELGVRIAIDGFGAGSTSLALLRRVQVDQIKLCRKLVADLGISREVTDIVRALVSVAAGLKIDAVAVGIETEAQFEAANRCGCRYAQGFLTGAPGSPERVLGPGVTAEAGAALS